MMESVSKPIAIVTGGSRGIGRAIVEELARTHSVVGTYNSNRQAADEVTRATGATFLPCQLNDDSSRAQLVQTVLSQHPAIDLLVNNAGMAPRQRADILEATSASFDEVVGTNLKGPYFLTQQIAKAMLANGRGRIVFVSSISSFTAIVFRKRRSVWRRSFLRHGSLRIMSPYSRSNPASSAPT
jgi:3-oxoacyl-[acyl-carrier protein] reductase